MERPLDRAGGFLGGPGDVHRKSGLGSSRRHIFALSRAASADPIASRQRWYGYICPFHTAERRAVARLLALSAIEENASQQSTRCQKVRMIVVQL